MTLNPASSVLDSHHECQDFKNSISTLLDTLLFFVQARQLENQIDTKLASLGKLGTNFSKSSSGSAKTPLLAGDETSNQSAFESLSAELSQLLGRLSEVRK